MKMLSEFINELQEVLKKEGDCLVGIYDEAGILPSYDDWKLKYDSYEGCTTTIDGEQRENPKCLHLNWGFS